MINRPSYDGVSRRMIAFAIYSAVIALLLATGFETCSATETLSSGSSSKTLRNQTVNSLPYQHLNQETKDKIADILKKPSIYRRLPVTAINADPDYFRFLIRYPEVIVNIWQLMGVTQMKTERTGPYSIDSNDGAGTISSLELIYGSENLHIFYGTGSYEGPILKRKLKGKAVLVLRSENKPGANGKPIATSQLDVFLKIDNATAGLIAKTIQPLVGTTADHNFVESLKFVQRLNETTEKNGPGVQQMGEKLKIDSGVRKQFNEVVDVVFQRAINASAPNTQDRSRRTSQNSNYPATSQTSPANRYVPTSHVRGPGRPPTNFNQQSTRPLQTTNGRPVYENLKDLGQVNPGYRNGAAPVSVYGAAPSHYGAGQQYPSSQMSGYQLPARGFQAPNYARPRSDATIQYQLPNGQSIKASYENAQPQSNVESASGWRPQR